MTDAVDAKEPSINVSENTFLSVLLDDFELNNGMNQNIEKQAKISNAQVKIDECVHKFTNSLTNYPQAIPFKRDLYDKLPKFLRE